MGAMLRAVDASTMPVAPTTQSTREAGQMSVRWRIRLAWTLLIGSLIGWPLSAFTWAKNEPPFILGLSWLAITLTALDILSTQDVRQQHEN